MKRRSDRRQAHPDTVSKEISEILHSAACSEAATIHNDRSIAYIGPVATKNEWSRALHAARGVVVESAQTGTTTTYADLQVATYRATRRKIVPRLYETFSTALNDYSQDGCLISSIVVASDSLKPGPGLAPFARSLGIDKSIPMLQADVFERFNIRATILANMVGSRWAPLLPDSAIDWDRLTGFVAIRCHHCKTVFGVSRGPLVAVVAGYPRRLDWFYRSSRTDTGVFSPVSSREKIVGCPAGHAVGYSLPQLLERNIRSSLDGRRDTVDA